VVTPAPAPAPDPAAASPPAADSPVADPPTKVDADALLVQRAVAGDAIAFEVLVVKYQRRVAATIRSLIRDVCVTEELTQEVFIRVYKALPDFSVDGNFRAWILTIARNVASSYLRSGQNRMEDRPIELDVGVAEVLMPHAGSAEDEVAARQLFALIDETIATLPSAQKTALLMREIDDLDYRSIAASLGMPVNTVKSHIYRAREAVAARVRPLLAPTRGRRW
jgi:RNA polymerase sigma-70 factor (ECF subfamily)